MKYRLRIWGNVGDEDGFVEKDGKLFYFWNGNTEDLHLIEGKLLDTEDLGKDKDDVFYRFCGICYESDSLKELSEWAKKIIDSVTFHVFGIDIDEVKEK